ncbi:MAG: glycosyltransferase, partial [Candidatus Dormibacteria bacterium]
MSTGTRAYLDALLDGLPRVAPDLAIARIGRGEHFGVNEHLRLPVEVLSQRPRLVHFITPVAPLVRPAPYVVTVHDLIHLRFPELHARQAQLYYAILGRRLIRGARRILVGDERTVEDCVRLVGVPPERCRVVPLGFDPVLLTDDAIEQRPHPYVFYAGNHRAHKNLATLFAAWHALPPSVELDCVVTGPNDLPAAVPRTRPGGAIVTLGQVDRARLSRLYRGALAYVHPALVEGFGIPMLEAAAVGTPVIAAAECVPAVVRGVA